VAAYKLIFDDPGLPPLDLLYVVISPPGQRGGVFPIHAVIDDSILLKPYEASIGGRCRVERTENDRCVVCHGAVASLDPVRIMADGSGWSHPV
jgi:hypothetical protein